MNPTATRYTLAPLAYPPRTKTERKQILQPILRQLLTKLGFKTGKRPEYDAHGNLKGNHAAWVRNVPSGRQYLTLDYEAYPGPAIFLNAYMVVPEATRLEQEILAIRQVGYVALTHEQTWLKLSHSQLCLSESENSVTRYNDQQYLQSLLDSVTEEALPLLDTLSTCEGLNRIINGVDRGKYALPEDFLGRLAIAVLSGPTELDVQANRIPQLIERFTEISGPWTRMPERYIYWHVDALSDWPRILEIARSFKPGTIKPDNASAPVEFQESPEQQWTKLLAALPFPPYMHLQDIDEDLWTYVPPPGFWPDDIRRDIRDMPLPQAKAWSALWSHCMEAKGATPGKTWLKKAAQILAPLQGDHSPVMARWLDWMTNHSHQVICPYWCGDKIHEAVVLGFVWCASLGDPTIVADSLANFTAYCHGWGWQHKVDLRRRSEKIMHAGFWSLSQLGEPGFQAIAALDGQGIQSYKHGALDKMTGSSRLAVIERSLTDAPFDEQGQWETRCGPDLTLRFDTENWTTQILNGAGQVLSRIPTKLRDQYAVRLNQWQDIEFQVRKRPGLIKAILEEAWSQQRPMTGAYWLDRYGGNVHALAEPGRRLIWRIEQEGVIRDVFWQDNAWRDRDGNVSPPIRAESRVCLWHQDFAQPDEISFWRSALTQRLIQQPVAQV